jgi:rhodanese-related sulfurtransferase
MSAAVPEMTVKELKALMDEGKTPFLLDVRRPEEYGIANLDGTLIPLHELEFRLDELASRRQEPIVVYCRSGARSGTAVQFLRAHGFDKALNLKGGVLAWSHEIDPSMPTY